LTHSLKCDADGTLQPVPVEQAMDEIAARLGQILDEHGPRSIATYHGTQLQNMPAQSLMGSFMSAIGSPMTFSAFTVDKPGRPIAWDLLGRWMAPHQGFDDPRVALMIGINRTSTASVVFRSATPAAGSGAVWPPGCS
jgi:anaerobic selenocysteine-containing dehydrogenase